MKRIIFLISFLLITVSDIWGQGQITRPKITEHTKKETPKQTINQNQSTSTLPNSTETINGITVHWNGVTQNQKLVIANLLNNMVYVPGGSFMMGSNDSDAHNNEKPVHRETVSSFRIDKYEVTQKLWQTVMGNNPSYSKGESLPVDNISWDDCQDFIMKLNGLTGLSFRLPTEAEWEYAARGGNRSNGYKYSGSNTIENVGWYYDNSGNKPHPVGTKSPNELGLYDMTGNVMEWTSDEFSSNYNSTPDNSYYVFRGGAWPHVAWCARISYRNYGHTTSNRKDVGFRLVL